MIGFGRRTYKAKGITKAQVCQKCSHERPFKMVEEKRWFSILFVPVFPYKKRDLLLCPICGAGYEVKGEVQILQTDEDQEARVKNQESAFKAIKEKFESGEITKNEYIRICNVLQFETQH